MPKVMFECLGIDLDNQIIAENVEGRFHTRSADQAAYLPKGWQVERGTLETGDIALLALPDGAVVERKTQATW